MPCSLLCKPEHGKLALAFLVLLFDVVEPLRAAEEVSTTDQTASDVRVVASLSCCIALKKLLCGLT